MPKNASAHKTVQAWKILNRPNCFIFNDAQAMTTVMVEMIRTRVLNVPIGMFSQPCGQFSRRADAQQDVGGEQRAEQHDFRREKQPDADLGVVKAGVRARLDCVGNFHECSGLRLGLVLRGEILSLRPGTLYSYGPR